MVIQMTKEKWPKPSPEALTLLQPVLDWLEAGAPHQNISNHPRVGFNMEWFITSGDRTKTDCGTVCCIAGAVALFSGDTAMQAEYVETVGYRLDMTEPQIKTLFYAKAEQGYDGKRGYEYGKCGSALSEDGDATDLYLITPLMAATTLKHFMATGEVIWASS